MLASPTRPQGHVALAQVDMSSESCLNVGLWASEFQLLWVLLPQHILGLPAAEGWEGPVPSVVSGYVVSCHS